MSMITHEVTPTEALKMIKRCLAAGRVPILRSSPGMGKTEMNEELAEEYNLLFLDFRLAQADFGDLNGLPMVKASGQAAYAPFEDFPLEDTEIPINPKTNLPYAGWLLMFDEITAARKDIQAAAYKILLDRKMGQRKLHPQVYMVAAGNHTTDKAVAYEMSTALQSRLIHLDLKVSKKDWVEWALKKGVDDRVIAFIEFKPELLHSFKPDHVDHTYPCPRTWYFVHTLIKGQAEIDHNDMPLIAGTIGPGAATEFIEFTKVFGNLPKIADIENSPEYLPIPPDPSIRYALACMLANEITDKNADKMMVFLQRLPVECRALCLRMLNTKNPRMMRIPEVSRLFASLVRA